MLAGWRIVAEICLPLAAVREIRLEAAEQTEASAVPVKETPKLGRMVAVQQFLLHCITVMEPSVSSLWLVACTYPRHDVLSLLAGAVQSRSRSVFSLGTTNLWAVTVATVVAPIEGHARMGQLVALVTG